MADPTTANRMMNQGESALENKEEAVEIESKKVEWEEETKDEESGGQLKENCEKLKKNINHHRRMIPIVNVWQLIDGNGAGLDELNTEDVIALEELKTYPDRLKAAADAVVQIRVRKGDGILHNGTGLLVLRPPDSTGQASGTSGTGTFKFAVLTNYHVLKKPKPNNTGNQPNQDDTGNQPNQDNTGNQPNQDDTGNQPNQDNAGNQPNQDNTGNQPNQDNTGNQQPGEQLVEPKDIEVRFFYDSEEVFNNRGVTCAVDKVLWKLSMSRSNSQQGEERLDFILMTIKPPSDEAKKNSLLQLEPLPFEETTRVQVLPVGTPLCIIGHPHGAFKHVTFGNLNSDPKDLFREWQSEKKVHQVEHVVPTCSGSSGSPVFAMNGASNSVHRTGMPFFPFLHFQANSKYGDAVSSQSILPRIRERLNSAN